jgi:hypothetical protein
MTKIKSEKSEEIALLSSRIIEKKSEMKKIKE